MKKVIILFVLLPLFAGCNYLEMDPEDLNSIEKVFSNRNDTRMWFARIYSGDYFPNELFDSQYYNHYMFAIDDACNILDAHTTPMVLGNVSPSQPVFGWDTYFFGKFYQAIRHCNIFLENIERCTELGAVERDRMVAEARFMRAIYHFWILRAYGPIPIVEKSVDSQNAGVKTARNSMDECVKWLCDEIDAALPNMLDERQNQDWGFPTKDAALAMKSRILLVAASPMYNGNSVYAGWKNNDGKQLVNQTYDANKWKAAADAALRVINMGKYQLHKVSKANPTFDDYITNYREITTTWNEETIWPRPAATGWWTASCWPAVFQGWNARNSVTLELVNAYFMADGSVAKPMADWFSPLEFSTAPGNGTQANTFSMLVGREPRFYASTMFPNQRISFASPRNPGVYETLEFWYTGNCGVSKSSGDRNSTGFTMLKNIPMDAYSDKSLNEASSGNVPFPVIRLAEVYLNYCEAMNEWNGASTHNEILPYLNAIRDRAGIPGYTGSFTKEQMREMIRQERRIELAWEVHRYFDVRRWFIAHGEKGVLNTPVHGLDVSRGEHATDPAFFTLWQAQIRVFRLEHYMLPIRAAEVAFNTELIQAPFY